ncbi:MAG: prepilin-type N-terminal cleavage/methylation domain-containing protein [Gemmataceae bacterium]
MKRRAGATLVEVLVAIFVMGIGLLALLTMFPIGILTMQQAIIDQRTAHVVQNAVEIAEIKDIRNGPFVDRAAFPQAALTSPFVNPRPNILSDAPPDQPSHPLFVDPYGTELYLGNSAGWVGGQVNGLKRVSVPSALFPESPQFGSPNIQQRLKWFGSLDEIVFSEDSVPETGAGNYERNLNYTWAYLARRPMTDAAVVDLSVVVYHKRPIGLVKSLQTGEDSYGALFDMKANKIYLSNPGSLERLVPGTWILDATTPTITVNMVPSSLPCHAQFYKVVGTTLVNGGTQLEVEVQQPLRLPYGKLFKEYQQIPPPPMAPTQEFFTGRVVVLEWVVDVVRIGSGRGPN